MYMQCQKECVEMPGLHCKCVAVGEGIGEQAEVAVTVQIYSGGFCSTII